MSTTIDTDTVPAPAAPLTAPIIDESVGEPVGSGQEVKSESTPVGVPVEEETKKVAGEGESKSIPGVGVLSTTTGSGTGTGTEVAASVPSDKGVGVVEGGVTGAGAGAGEEGVKDKGAVTPPKDKKTQTRGLFSRLFHTFSHDGTDADKVEKVKSPKKEKKVKTPKIEKTQAAAEGAAVETPGTTETSTVPAVAIIEPVAETTDTPAAAVVAPPTPPTTETAVVAPIEPVGGATAEAPKETETAPVGETATGEEKKDEKPVHPKINRRLSARIGQFIGKVTSKKEHGAAGAPESSKTGASTGGVAKEGETVGSTAVVEGEDAKKESAPVLDAPTALAPLGDVSEPAATELKPTAPSPSSQVAATA